MHTVNWYGPGTLAWNPIHMRCTPCSPGCEHCWHLRAADRLVAAKHPQAKAYAGGKPVLNEAELEAPLRRRKPTLIATQFMGDLWHPSVTNQMRDRVLHFANCAPHHRFLCLTKRPDMMEPKMHIDLNNVGFGVSVCTQAEADEKIPQLRRIPAAFHWLSVEPMLEGIRFPTLDGIDWVVVGGESGPHARYISENAIRDLIQQCEKAHVPVWYKQAGDAVSRFVRQYPPRINGVVYRQLPSWLTWRER